MITITPSITPTLAIFGLPGGSEWIIILIIGLLLFGRRLPEVGRSIGQSIVEFKKGLKGVSDDVEQASNQPSRPQQLADRSSTESMRQMDQQRTDTKVS
jgi:sec-independent protein translocase protein TatA